MKTKFRSRLFDETPEYKIEKKYLPYFKNINLRNNQNYILWNKDKKYIQFYSSYTFIWWSMLRIIYRKKLIKFKFEKIKEFLPILFIVLSLLLFSESIFLLTIFSIISLGYIYTLIFNYYYIDKNILAIKDKNKFIIYKNKKWKIK